MSLRLIRPPVHRLRSLAEAGATDALTYETVGMSSMAVPPDGYRLDRWSQSLGYGDAVFRDAADALRTWHVHRRAGLLVEASGPPEANSIIAMAAPLPMGWIEAVCRIVDVVDQPDMFGFTYGTLSVHPEEGEESFTVLRVDQEVCFQIISASKPRQWLARTLSPIARHLQVAANEGYMMAMRSVLIE